MAHLCIKTQHESLQTSDKGDALSSFLEMEGKKMEQSNSYCVWLKYGFCLRGLQKDSDLAGTIMKWYSPPSKTRPLFED